MYIYVYIVSKGYDISVGWQEWEDYKKNNLTDTQCILLILKLKRRYPTHHISSLIHPLSGEDPIEMDYLYMWMKRKGWVQSCAEPLPYVYSRIKNGIVETAFTYTPTHDDCDDDTATWQLYNKDRMIDYDADNC